MVDRDYHALQRAEIRSALERGEAKIAALLERDGRAWPAGSSLVGEDCHHDYVYLLSQGWAGRVRRLEDGRSQLIMLFLPGDLMALKSMFMTVHVDAVVALSDIVVERVHQHRLREAFDADSDVASRCLWQVMEEERRLHNWVVTLGRGSADERLARLLVDFRARLVLAGRLPASCLRFALPLTQEQLGDHLGISAVHVSRILGGLRQAGLASVRSGMAEIHDMGGLVRLALPLLDETERRTPAYVGPLEADRTWGVA